MDRTDRTDRLPTPIRPRHRRRFAGVLFAAALLGGGAAACGDDTEPTQSAEPTQSVGPTGPNESEPPDESGESGSAEDGPGTDTPAPGAEAAEAALAEDRTVIDVRTVEEYDAGHVDGAERIGLADADFADRVADLDPDVGYVVYCRTGNRSAQAATAMRDAGLDVVDGGAFDDMVAAGWPAA